MGTNFLQLSILTKSPLKGQMTNDRPGKDNDNPINKGPKQPEENMHVVQLCNPLKEKNNANKKEHSLLDNEQSNKIKRIICRICLN